MITEISVGYCGCADCCLVLEVYDEEREYYLRKEYLIESFPWKVLSSYNFREERIPYEIAKLLIEFGKDDER